MPRRAVLSCLYCGDPFPTPRLDSRYCSGACRVQAHRLRTGVAYPDRQLRSSPDIPRARRAQLDAAYLARLEAEALSAIQAELFPPVEEPGQVHP